MFLEKIGKFPSLNEVEKYIQRDNDVINYHQTILNAGYGWWQNAPEKFGYSDMIIFVDKQYGRIFGTLILIGKLNQQVNNGGFLQYYNNYYSRENENDYGQNLHVRIIKDLSKIIGKLNELKALNTIPEIEKIDENDIALLNTTLVIFQDYLKVPIDLEPTYEDEVEYGDEKEGYWYETEEVENENFGDLADLEALEKLNLRYYEIDERFMEIMEIVSKLSFDTELNYEPLYKAFINNLKEKYHIDIKPTDIQWTGFGSVGDGLCFNFSINDYDVTQFLDAISAPHQENFNHFWNTDCIYACVVSTKNNELAINKCNSKTRDIKFWFENYEPDVEKYRTDINRIKDDLKKIEDHIGNWYRSVCDGFYDSLKIYYLENSIQNTESKITNIPEIDPEMNIEKVAEMFQDAYDLGNTKDEAAFLIEKFIKNFNNEYLIIKKG